jgi:hypothetical protein
MLKALNINDTLVTPFTTTKDWHLSNSENTDLILFEHTSSDGNPIAVAVEFIDYGDGSKGPFINSSCSLSNEKQSLNLASVREGKRTTGIFFPNEQQNLDGTYKRMVYSQVQRMFYNNYRDPTKMWGMEEIDFDKSQAKKFLTDKFVLVDVPTRVMGEKMLPNTIQITDTTSDNNYFIVDDGRTNLLIGTSIFSKQQELRVFENQFISSSDGTCNGYFNIVLPSAPILSGVTTFSSFFASSATASLSWVESISVDGFNLEKSLNGLSFLTLAILGGGIFSFTDSPISASTTYYYRISAFNSLGSSSYSNVVSVIAIPIYDDFDEYAISQSANFDSGSGWGNNVWKIDPVTRFVATDSFDTYTVGQSASFNSGLGWNLPWTVVGTTIILSNTESFNEYSVGQTSNFNGGLGWSSSIWLVRGI